MTTGKVSSSFNKFYARNSQAIQSAKKAEARTSDCPLPIGATGKAIIINMIFDKFPDRQDPATKAINEGADYCRLELRVIDSTDHQGKAIRKTYNFKDNATVSATTQFEWFLNELEGMGLDRSVRENHESPQELIDALMNEPTTVEFEVAASNSTYNDGKKVILRKVGVPVDTTTSVVPDDASVYPASGITTVSSGTRQTDSSVSHDTSSTIPSDHEVGDVVSYLSQKWVVEAVAPPHLTVKSQNTGKVKQINIGDLD